MGVLFLAFVSLLATDFATGFGLFMPRLAPSLRGWALIIGGLLSVLALFQGIRSPVIQGYVVRLPGLPAQMEGTVVIAMSDMHLGSVLGEKWAECRSSFVEGPARGDLVCGSGAHARSCM